MKMILAVMMKTIAATMKMSVAAKTTKTARSTGLLTRLATVCVMLSVMFPYAYGQDVLPTGDNPNMEPWMEILRDGREILTDVTTIQGYQQMAEIVQEHGFSKKTVDLLWSTSKIKMLFLTGTSLYVTHYLRKAALIPVAFYGTCYGLRLALDRYWPIEHSADDVNEREA